ncbi:MAG: protein dpnD [Clostridia bacterium]|nr:protein dpnD [Clostridia bacterium]
MKKFTIAIEETVVEEFEIKAKNFEEALEIAAEKYRKGEFVLCPGEVQFRQMAVVKPSLESTEWTEF